MIKIILFLVVFLFFNAVYCSQEQKHNETKQIVCKKITIYTAEGPKEIYDYGFKDVHEDERAGLVEKKEKKKSPLNEFEKADLILKAVKDKKIKPKL